MSIEQRKDAQKNSLSKIIHDIENLIETCVTVEEVKALHKLFELEVGIIRPYFAQIIDEIELDG